jgi:hypothetical protein
MSLWTYRSLFAAVFGIQAPFNGLALQPLGRVFGQNHTARFYISAPSRSSSLRCFGIECRLSGRESC